jgi:choline transport protein
VTPAFCFGGLDAIMHLVEKTVNPRKAVSRAICFTMGMGLVTAFLFTVAMAYYMDDINLILSTPTLCM